MIHMNNKTAIITGAGGGIDVLINHAGLSHRCGVEEITEDLFDQIMKVNVRAVYIQI